MELSFLKEKNSLLSLVEGKSGIIKFEEFPQNPNHLPYLSSSHTIAPLFLLWNSKEEIDYLIMDEVGSGGFYGRSFTPKSFVEWTSSMGIKYSDNFLNAALERRPSL